MNRGRAVCALIIVRGGMLPAGADEVFEMAGNVGVFIGDAASTAAATLVGDGTIDAIDLEAGEFTLADCARLAAERDVVQSVDLILVPSSPDGRDVAPRLAAHLNAALLCGAVRVITDDRLRVDISRQGGWVIEQHHIDDTVTAVVTVIPGLSGITSSRNGQPHITTTRMSPINSRSAIDSVAGVRSLEVLPPDPATMDLTEASSIVAGGQGLKSAAAFQQLARVGAALGASLGGTRVASDAGWIPFERQIGTTGLMVTPKVYIAFGVSGATQHTSGLGSPELVISVNTDPSCPMMNMADVAIVSDAIAVVAALESKLVQVSPQASAQVSS